MMKWAERSRKTKVRVYTVIVRPVVLYTSETWRFTKQMERRLEVFENGVLRQICGPVREAGVWRRRHNEELRKLTGVPWITDIVKSKRLRWSGHVVRQEEDAIPKMAMIGRPEGRRPVCRPRKRWRGAGSTTDRPWWWLDGGGSEQGGVSHCGGSGEGTTRPAASGVRVSGDIKVINQSLFASISLTLSMKRKSLRLQETFLATESTIQMAVIANLRLQGKL